MALITVSGQLNTILGVAVPNGTVTFLLTNLEGNLPYVSGTNIIVPTIVTVTANASGAFTANIQGNDTITPAGSIYQVTYVNTTTSSYVFTGAGPINLNSYPPLSQIPVPVGPVPTNILTGNNIFTGTDTFNGVATFNAGIVSSGPNTFSGLTTAKNIESVRYVDTSNTQGWSGADPGAWINSAIADMGGQGTVFFSCLNSPPTATVSSNPFAGRLNADRIHLIIGSCSITTSVRWSFPENTWIQGQGPRNTTLIAGMSDYVLVFCSSATAPDAFCRGTSTAQSVHVTDLTINANKSAFAGSGGILYQNTDLPSSVRNVIIQDFGSLGGANFIQTNFGNAAGAGGSAENIWVLGDSTGITGGNGAGTAITLDSINHFNCKKCFAQYAANGMVIKNLQNVAPTEIQVIDYENEGISGNGTTTGFGLDLQANVRMVSVWGWAWFDPPSGTGFAFRAATGVRDWNINSWNMGGSTHTTPITNNGTTYTPSNLSITKYTDQVFWNKDGFEVYGPGNNVPADPTSPYHGYSNVTNCMLLGTSPGVNNIAMQCGGQITSGALLPNVAGGSDLGSTLKPWGNLWLGTAATNNWKLQPTATSALRTLTLPADPGVSVGWPVTIASGTKALNTASITTATCDAGTAATATGTLSTDTVDWSFSAAPTATNKYGAFLVVYAVPSTNTVTFYTCNPSATTSTPTAMSINWSVRRP